LSEISEFYGVDSCLLTTVYSDCCWLDVIFICFYVLVFGLNKQLYCAVIKHYWQSFLVFKYKYELEVERRHI